MLKYKTNSRGSLIRLGAWFFLFNTLLFLIIASRYLKYFSDVDNFITIFYLVIATSSHFAFLSFTLILLYIPISLIIPNKTICWIWAGVLSTVSSSLLLLDTFVFDLYRMHINKFVLELVFGGGGTQIFEFHTIQYILVSLVIVGFLALVLFLSYKFFTWKRQASLRKGWIVALSVVVMMIASHFMHAWAHSINYTPITKSSRYYPLYFPTTANKLMLKLGVTTKEKMNEMVLDNDNSATLNYPKQHISIDTTVSQNIILILIDSWYYKSLDSTIMPNVYNFSKQCEVYTHHYSGSNGTRTGVFSIFYSIPGTFWDIVLASRTSPVLMDVLNERYYQISTHTSATLANPPFDKTIFGKVKNLNIETQGANSSERDIQLTKEWLSETERRKLEKDSTPIFSFLFYDALHSISHPADFKGPFQPEWEYPKYQLLSNDLDPTPFYNLYKNSAYYIDSLVGHVLDDLKQKGYFDNSWVIITGDHGQEFNDNKKNFWGHNGNYSAAQMQIPLLIYKPGGEHHIYNHWTSHYDLAPTLMTEMFKCTNAISDYSIGKLLGDTTKREWLLVGSNDNFAILQPDRINSVYFNGTFDITDSHLNPVENARLDTKLMNEVMMISKSFYK